MTWCDSYWRHRHDGPQRPGIKTIATSPVAVIPLDVLRRQVELVAIDFDSDTQEYSHPDDRLLLGMLAAAVDHAEDFTGLAIAQHVYELALDGFPWSSPWAARSGIELPHPPFVGIDSFLCTQAGSDGELDQGTDYLVDDYRTPAQVRPVTSWPVITRSVNAVTIRYRAGYANPQDSDTEVDSDFTSAPPLPPAIRQALLLLVGHFWNNREDSVEKALSSIPNGFEALLRPKRADLGMA